MIRQQIMRSARARGGATGSEVEIPLPLSGFLSKAKTAKVSGGFAAEVNNWRLNGVSMEIASSYSIDRSAVAIQRRVPFEFGSSPHFVNLRSELMEGAAGSYSRAMSEDASAAFISGQAVFADGNGPIIRYDGATFAECAFFTTAAVDVETLDGVIAHHDRLFFWKTDGDLEFYYGDVGAVQGELTLFPLSRLGNITGRIVAMSPLTRDAADNLNDSLCIMTSTGQIVVYEGTDPSDASNWSLSARVASAPPLGKHAMTKVGGDVWMATKRGIVSVLDSISKGVLALVSDLARPIAERMVELAEAGGDWQLITSSEGDQIIINRYLSGASVQMIYYPEGRAWGTADYPARRWHNLDGTLSFTDPDGYLGVIGAGDAITATWNSAWLGLRGVSQVVSITPTIIGTGPITLTVAVLSDHDETAADVTEATQTVTLNSDDPVDSVGRVSLDEVIPIGAVGSVFQIRLSITATSAELVDLKAMVA